MSKKNTRSHNWVLTLSGATLWGHCPWDTVLKRYVDDKKLRFVAYHKNTRPETGAPCYRVYCVFTNQVRFNTVVRFFPASTCVPVHGKLGHDPEYCSNEAAFIKLGVEPAQGRRKNLGDAVGVQCKKRKLSENEAAQGLERKPAAAEDLQREYNPSNEEVAHGLENLPKNLGREYDPSSKEKDQMLDDLKKQLETSKALAEEERKEAERIKTQLDIAAPVIIDQFRQAFISDCKARGRVGYYVSTARILGDIYALQPPLRKEDKLVMQTTICGSINKALKLARLHYHPDRQCKGGYWCQTMCMEITKLLNYINEAACIYSIP
jgi:hypothetical protein